MYTYFCKKCLSKWFSTQYKHEDFCPYCKAENPNKNEWPYDRKPIIRITKD